MFIKSRNLKYKYNSYDDETDVKSDDNEKYAVNGVDIDIKKGDFIAILGHNGSGKSTFAKHLNALLKPTSGTLFVNDLDTCDDKNIWDIRQSTGMVFQNPDNQIIANVVEEDVGFGPENIGIETKEIWERVTHALKSVGMIEYSKHSPNKLSGGQKQRVAIAGVMAMKPDCIVLDEPTAMLDPSGRKEVLDAIWELNKKENVTIILITHHMDEVLLADKVFVMHNGKIELQGSPKEVFSNVDVMKNIALDVPQITETVYELQKLGYNLPNGIITETEFVTEISKLFL